MGKEITYQGNNFIVKDSSIEINNEKYTALNFIDYIKINKCKLVEGFKKILKTKLNCFILKRKDSQLKIEGNWIGFIFIIIESLLCYQVIQAFRKYSIKL